PFLLCCTSYFNPPRKERKGPPRHEGRACASRNEMREHPLKITLPYQGKKEKFHYGIRFKPCASRNFL
ncbi:hypothetical protein, partial [Faecalispora jeddahensis]|uniref:hypothetical protein n=1 Tax=Faecalispora jeddahensis TaxID=1414721 RepID=UPI0027B8ABBF